MQFPHLISRKKLRLLVTVIFCPVLLLSVSWVCVSQTVTASSGSVDRSKLEPVVLRVTKADGTSDTAVASQVATIKVGETTVEFKRDDQGNITIVPPANPAGTHLIQLLDTAGNPVKDSSGNPLKAPPLMYSGASSSPTPDMNWVRENNAEVRKNKLAGYWWYYPVTIALYFVLMGGFVLVIGRGIWLARATYRTPTGLPTGSFRAILAYTLVLFLGFYVLASLLSISYFAPPEFLLGIVATVIGFYFGSRSGEEGGLDTRTGVVRGTVRKQNLPVSGATVKFKTSDDKEPYSRISDVDGRFHLMGAKAGKYTVIASTTSPAATGQQEITVAEGSDHEITINLNGDSTTGQPDADASGNDTGEKPPPTNGENAGSNEAGGGNAPGDSAAPPAATGSIVGTVLKADGNPPEKATVQLFQGTTKVLDQPTDANGQFKIEGLAPGAYQIQASSDSPLTSSEKRDIAVAVDTPATIDLRLA